MKKQKQQGHNILPTTKSQQTILPLGISYQIPEESPVRLLWQVLEGMEFPASSSNAHKSALSPREKTAIIIFSAMNGIYSSRGMEQACQYDIRFMWLLDGKPTPDHSVLSRFRAKELPEILQSLFAQLMDHLAETGEIDYETVFIDGTKIEANANRYSFVWRKSIEKYLSNLKEKAAAKMGVALSDIKLAALLESAASKRREMVEQGLETVHGRGKRKSPHQRDAEELEQMACKWQEYEKHLEIMGSDRNSYSKTDHDATFMRMKDDHMKNGQLKAGYNVQLATNSEYIVGYDVFDHRNDMGTLKSLLSTLETLHKKKYKSVTADAGYESLENYSHLEECEQLSFIKPSNYDRRNKKSKWIGRFEDMDYDALSDTFTCKAGKALSFSGKRTRKNKSGYESEVSVYTCCECAGCDMRACCSRAKDETKKSLEVCWDFQRLRGKSLENITSEKGIIYRINRSIQAEGAFGIIKQDWGFRRFLTRGKDRVLTQIGILAIAFNVNKLAAKIRDNRTKSQLFLPNSA